MGTSAERHAGRRILIVEDDAALRLALDDRLSREGYQVQLATRGDEGARLAISRDLDLIILDVMLPGRSGFEIARELRNRDVETPILMLTARGEVTDRVVGLQFGADDYLTKPFEFIELLARIEALLRRARLTQHPKPELETARYGEIEIDFRSARVFRRGEPVPLSSKELQLLRFFVENAGAAITRDELLDAVWGYDTTTNTRTVDMHVARLRQKLETDPNDPKLIVTVRGLGYRFEA
jgi:two-component system alkaline phosphatase synthesis response regulator PhoP